MITDWVGQYALIGLALVVVFGPGLAVGSGLRLRGLALWAAAPGISIGLLALLAILFPFIGVRWGQLSALIAVAIVAAMVWGASFIFERSRWSSLTSPRRPAATALLIAGLVVGGGLNAAGLMTYIGVPSAISQTNDAVFHLNALRWVEETGSVSSFDITGLIGSNSFYPAAWHAVTSLVAFDTATIPIAANVVALVIAAVVWPLGIAMLARVISGGSALVTALAAALSAGMHAFPQLMFEWGVLYPYALSVAIVPAAVALTILAVRAAAAVRGRERFTVSAGYASAALLAVATVTLSQPSTVLVWAVLVMLWGSNVLVLRYRRGSHRQRIATITTLVAGWILVGLVWLTLAYLAGTVLWRAYLSPIDAIADVLLNSHSLLPPALGMSILLVIGLILAIRRSHLRWLLVAWIGVSLLYIISVGTDLPVVKRALTGPWYGDSFRLASIVPVIVVPLAAIALAALVRWIAAVGRTRSIAVMRRGPLTLTAVATIAIVGIVGLVITPVTLLRVAAETDEQSRYALNDRSYLSEDEYALLVELPENVPENALLIANPSTGAAFAYLLGDRDIVPRTWSPPQSTAWQLISTELRDAADNPDVCDALLAYGQPEYVLDFGPGDTRPGQYLMQGMTDFDGQAGFEEVAREGDASLWRITACG